MKLFATVLEARPFLSKRGEKLTSVNAIADEGLFKVLLKGNGVKKGDQGFFEFDALRNAVFGEFAKEGVKS